MKCCHEKSYTTRSLVNARHPSGPCDGNAEIGTYCDDRSDRRNTKQKKRTREDVGMD